MGCRDMEKCEAAAKEIRGKTLNHNVYACRLDLSSMKSIREFAERIKRGEVEIKQERPMQCLVMGGKQTQ